MTGAACLRSALFVGPLADLLHRAFCNTLRHSVARTKNEEEEKGQPTGEELKAEEGKGHYHDAIIYKGEKRAYRYLHNLPDMLVPVKTETIGVTAATGIKYKLVYKRRQAMLWKVRSLECRTSLH